MTKIQLMKQLKQLGWAFEEGANHTLAISPDGSKKVPIPRHKGDLKIKTLKSIQRSCGLI